MKLEEVKQLAILQGIKIGKMKKVEVIRMIQQNEGNETCFDTDHANHCGQEQCLWRGDCA